MTHVWPNRGLTDDFRQADAAALVGRRGHACVFFDDRDGRLCRIHGTLGHDALPLACRQFPRVSVLDPRGVSVTLSHYCPTAAGLLNEVDPIAIVDAPPAYPPGAEYVGLDARTSLPPLLRPDILMDWNAWWDWERLAVEHLAVHGDSAARALDELAAAVERLRPWKIGDGVLAERVHAVFSGERSQRHTRPERRSLVEDVLDTIPGERRPAKLDIPGRPSDSVTRRFLAAHAFANWTALLGQGLRTWLRSLDAALAFLDEGFGVRQTDLVLRHLADPYELAKMWSLAEMTPGVPDAGLERRV